MKDEIKEILEGIEVVIKHDGTLEFNAKELKILLDYITNLQTIEQQYSAILSENAELENKITNLQEENQIDKYKTLKELQEENEELKEKIENLTTMTVCGDRKQIKNTAQYKLDIYKSRINKAIHRIQLLQMDNEVTVKDLGLIARDLTGGDE